MCVRITRSLGGVLLGSGGKDEGRFTQEGAKHEHRLHVLLPNGERLLEREWAGPWQQVLWAACGSNWRVAGDSTDSMRL